MAMSNSGTTITAVSSSTSSAMNDSAMASISAVDQSRSIKRYTPGVNTAHVIPKCSKLPPITSGLTMERIGLMLGGAHDMEVAHVAE